jgi:flagellar hook protein FlgE
MALTSMYSGLSGLNANALALSLIGNNLSNSNTVGYKSSTANFQDLLSQTLSGGSDTTNPMQVGLGTTPAGTSMNLSQGSLQSTGIASNMAIQGDGFFVVSSGEGGYNYTRAGNFNVDAQGDLVTSDGKFVQGYTQKDPTTQKIIATGTLDKINIPPGTLFPPTATTNVQLLSNLNADATTGSVFTSSLRVIDSLGASHQLNFVYTKGANPGEWSYDVTIDGGEVTGGTAGTAYSLIGASGAAPTAPAGTMAFDTTGKLTTVDGNPVLNGTPPPVLDPAVVPINITTPTFANGAAAMTFAWDVAKPEGTSYTSYLTSYASPSATSSSNQNGFAAGSLSSFTVSEDGTVVGVFSNGQTAELARIALATFNDPAGLLKIGSNNYSASTACGEPSIGAAAEGGRGKIAGSSLELSNVDIASEFINMIIAQRGYQANSRVITTTDQVLQESINLVR